MKVIARAFEILCSLMGRNEFNLARKVKWRNSRHLGVRGCKLGEAGEIGSNTRREGGNRHWFLIVGNAV